MKSNQHQRGFGVIGMVIVMLVVGAAALLLPRLLLTKHTQSTQLTDLQALQAAKTAVISDALSKGVLTAAAGVTTACSRGIMPSTLGVNNWGVFGTTNTFCMDVSDALTGFTPPVTLPKTATLCANARAELNAPVAGPRICQDTTRATANCTPSAPMAFVIYSTGNDRVPNLENLEAGVTSGNPGYRIYENDLRGINNAPGTDHYDDQVVSYPLAQLVKDCATVPVPSAPVSCSSGTTLLSINNSSTVAVYVKVGTGACNLIANTAIPISYSGSCIANTGSVITSNQNDCSGGGNTVNRGLLSTFSSASSVTLNFTGTGFGGLLVVLAP